MTASPDGIWGRGSWDDKGNLYSMLEAAETMAWPAFAQADDLFCFRS
jgi:acetylornithine deacetylase/succinyl-diaminopimelate desuccinylase-like protein